MKKAIVRCSLVAGAILLLWMLNPSEQDFIHYVIKIRGEINPNDTATAVEQLIISKRIEKGELNYDNYNHIVFNYKKYIVLSTGEYVQDKDQHYREIRHRYIGIAGIFIPFGNDYRTY